jgi:hypothetical protein
MRRRFTVSLNREMKKMPFALLVRVTIFVGSMLVALGSLQHPVHGEGDGTSAARQEGQQFDSINFQGRSEFEISDPAQVPAQIARAAAEAGCNYQDGVKRVPLRFINADQRRFVLVYCDGIVGTHQVFDLSDLRRPKRFLFPFLARDMGLGATPRPGLISWRKDVGLFEALTGTDTCPSSRLRHIYRQGTTEGWSTAEPSFVLIRIDVMENGCGNGPWSTVWEAPQWPKAVIVR